MANKSRQRSSQNQLDIFTKQVLNRIRKPGLKSNKDKCVFRATKEMPFPKSEQDLQQFLGMVAYLSKFILQLSEQTYLLGELVKKNSIWGFTVTHRNQFDKLR